MLPTVTLQPSDTQGGNADATPRRLLAAVLAPLLLAGAVACAHPRPSGGPPAPAAPATPRGSASRAPACRWTSDPTPFYQSRDTLYQVWTLPAARAAGPWAEADVPALAEFRRAVADSLQRAGLSAAPADIVRRSVAYFGAKGDAGSRGEAANGRLVLAGAAGTVRAPSCAEALVLDYQARRFSMIRQPAELHAFFLRRDRGPEAPAGPGRGAGAVAPTRDDSVLVYFAASGGPYPPSVGRLAAAVDAKVAEGWRVAAHLHNHPFYLDRRRQAAGGFPRLDVAGGVAPSITDVQFYRAMRQGLGLEAARVTNGFATLEVPAAAFGRLHARGDATPP